MRLGVSTYVSTIVDSPFSGFVNFTVFEWPPVRESASYRCTSWSLYSFNA